MGHSPAPARAFACGLGLGRVAWTYGDTPVARARNIKPGFFCNDDLARCEYGARLLFVGLWCVADREGRMEDRPLRIKGVLFPFDSCDVEPWLTQLTDGGFITRYESGGRKYIQVNNFRKHQHPHVKEPASTIPAPDSHHAGPADCGLLITDTGLLNPDTGIPKSRARRRPARGRHFTPPTTEQVAAYCLARNNGIDPQAFIDHYTANGWKVGKNPMKDWQAAVRTWERSEFRKPPAEEGCRPLRPDEFASWNPITGGGGA